MPRFDIRRSLRGTEWRSVLKTAIWIVLGVGLVALGVALLLYHN
jgi:hypothetical protein